MSGSDHLTAKDARLIEALLLGATQAQAAKHAGVSEATVRRRLKNPQFTKHLDHGQRVMMGALRRRVVATATVAVDRLRSAMADPAVPARTQVAAAGRLVQAAMSLVPAQVELDAMVQVAPLGERLDAEKSAIEKLMASLARIRENRTDATPDAIAAAQAGPNVARLNNGNGHAVDPSSN